MVILYARSCQLVSGCCQGSRLSGVTGGLKVMEWTHSCLEQCVNCGNVHRDDSCYKEIPINHFLTAEPSLGFLFQLFFLIKFDLICLATVRIQKTSVCKTVVQKCNL